MNDPFVPQTPHHGPRRPVMVIIHGTEVDDATSRAVFSGKSGHQGSCHYYIDDKGQVTRYLDEAARAWHAGQAFWAGITDINSVSIGIELLAISHSRKFDGPETVYTDAQMQALAALAKDICERHNIPACHVLGHQDVSCTRELEPQPGDTLDDVLKQPVAKQKKYDPGIHFNWKYLAAQGVGLWHDLEPVADDPVITSPERIASFVINMMAYGYDMRHLPGNKDHQSVIRAFQTHFLPWNVCGQITEQTVNALNILLQKKLG